MSEFTQYIGIPFKYNGRSRKELDCYGLLMLLYKELHGITLPDLESPTYLNEIADAVTEERAKEYWEPCELEVGCALIFSVRGYGSHVGYYLGDDRMIHTWEGTGGVMIERISFSWQNRLIGSYKWKS